MGESGLLTALISVVGTLVVGFIILLRAYLVKNSALSPEEKSKLDDLWKWHNVADEDQVKVWYVKKSLQNAIHQIVDVMKLMQDTELRIMKMQDKILEKLEKEPKE